MPVLVGNSKLLQSYTWLPSDNVSNETESDDAVPPSIQPYSCQRDAETHPNPLDSSSSDHEWDQMMAAIEEAGEVVVDLDAIAADLEAELNVTASKGGNIMQDLTDTLENVPLLETPRSNATVDVYNDVSILEPNCTESPDPLDLLSYRAFAAACSDIQAPTISGHHLDHMAFVVTMMNGTMLIVSGQQMRSADGILLEPLLLSKAKARNDWHKWQEAMASEMDSMHKMKVFELVNVPTDSKLIGVCWVYKLKLDAQQQATQYKAHLVTQGYAQHQGLDYDQTFSLVVCLQTVRILLSIARQYGLHAAQPNVSTAFLIGKIDKDMHVRIPPMFEAKETEV
ncbi:hypothetical protein NDA13_005664 [Ustilago tritici]|nr:hypothetical protein NDA13_005664 [Ustilago tritici]